MKTYEHFGIRLTPLYPKKAECEGLKEMKFAAPILARYKESARSTLFNYGVGVEVEAEHARNFPSDKWVIEGDNSLRNDGREYKTMYGHRIGDLPPTLLELEKYSNHYKFVYSERTSVHVHLDVRMMTMQEAKTLFLLYLLFEKGLFRFAGPNRVHNVFCVPYTESVKCVRQRDFAELARRTEKYSAINLGTMATFGTIEFRHMSGNADANHIFNWVLLLAHMKYYATHIPHETFMKNMLNLKTSSTFNHLKDEVFQGFSSLVVVDSREVDDAVTTAKLFL